MRPRGAISGAARFGRYCHFAARGITFGADERQTALTAAEAASATGRSRLLTFLRGRWMPARGSPGDSLRAAEYAIGFESLRFIIQVEAEVRGSVAALARELEIDPRPLRRFLAGADPTPALWRVLTDYTRQLDDKPLAPVGLLGFAVTAAALPEGMRREARVEMAYALIVLHTERGQEPPGWLNAVLNLWEG